MIPPVVASERGRAQTAGVTLQDKGEGKALESAAIEHESCVPETDGSIVAS